MILCAVLAMPGAAQSADGSKTKKDAKAAGKGTPAEPAEKELPHWSYKGAEGPDNWGDLGPEYALCKSGLNQTPIDLDGAVGARLPELQFAYDTELLAVANNGHTIQVEVPSGNSLKVNGARFQLVQYHFHAPSEHTVKGKSFDMELHLVHRNGKGELAVVGVLIRKGQANPAIEAIWKTAPPQPKKRVSRSSVAVNPESLLPKRRGYFHYVGSLTTPPCSEGVRWFVLREPIEASAEQIAHFSKLFKNVPTARPVMPLNSRFLLAPLEK